MIARNRFANFNSFSDGPIISVNSSTFVQVQQPESMKLVCAIEASQKLIALLEHNCHWENFPDQTAISYSNRVSGLLDVEAVVYTSLLQPKLYRDIHCVCDDVTDVTEKGTTQLSLEVFCKPVQILSL